MIAPSLNDVMCLVFGVGFVLLALLLVGGIYWRAKYGPTPKISGVILPPLSSQHPFIQLKAHEPCDSPKC